MRPGAARGRQGDPRDRGSPAGRLRGSRAGQGPHAGHRHGFLRVPDTVAGREVAGLDLLEPPAHAVGRHRAAGRPDRERDAGQGPAAAGQPARVRAGTAVARQRDSLRRDRLARLVEHLPARPERRAAAGSVSRPTRSSPGRSGSSECGRSRCSGTAGSRSCTGPARYQPGHPGSRVIRAERPGHAVRRVRCRRCRPTATRSRPSAAGPADQAVQSCGSTRTTGKTEVLQRDLTELPDEAYLPVPRAVDFEGPYGQVVHAQLYPPTNPEVARPGRRARRRTSCGCTAGRPGRSSRCSTWQKAYFTSRGIGIIDVNYGGSSGYGRQYRERLRRQWGMVDVQDAIAAARWVANAENADPARLAIRGGSAGGWTTLAAVTTGTRRAGRVFNAAVSYFGVSDLRGFVDDDPRLRVALPRRPDRPAARFRDRLRGARPCRARDRRRPARSCCFRAWTTRSCRPRSPRASPPTSPRTARATPTSPSRASRTASARRRPITAALEAELSFYGQILGFTPPGIPAVDITTAEDGNRQPRSRRNRRGPVTAVPNRANSMARDSRITVTRIWPG